MWQGIFRKFGIYALIGCCVFGLSGCVRYDVGLNFSSPYQGEFTQEIQLGKQLTSFSQVEADQWLGSLERRAKALGGRTEHSSPEVLTVSIPFSNTAELSERFNQFFESAEPSAADPALEILQLSANLQLQDHNFGLVQQEQLFLTVDLRALGVLSEQGSLVVNSGSLVDLQFSVRAPLGLEAEALDGSLSPTRIEPGQLLWALQPGQINRLTASFWLPNPVGIGGLVIVLLMLGSFWLKQGHLPFLGPKSVSASLEN